MTTSRQLGFANGQIGKSGYARIDQNSYALGLRTLRNGFIERAGPASSRSGTVFCEEVDATFQAARLIPFIFSPDPDQVYALEFGPFYMRVFKGRKLVTLPSKLIAAATKANPCQLTVNAHGYSTGDHIIIGSGSVFGMRQLNGRQYKITVTGANTFTLQRVDGANVDSTNFSTYISGGTVSKVYKLATPYAGGDLPRIYPTQSADVVTLVHKKYPMYELARTGDAAWTLLPIPMVPPYIPVHVASTVGAAGAENFKYRVTAIYTDGSESPIGVASAKTITAITAASPPVVTTSAAHGFADGDTVWVDLSDMTGLNQREFSIAVVGANQFSLLGIDTTGLAPGTMGSVARNFATAPLCAVPTAAAPNVLTWSGIGKIDGSFATTFGVLFYNIYREVAGVYGLIGTSAPAKLTFSDTGFLPDISITPPVFEYILRQVGDYPGVVCYYQERQGVAASDNEPEKARFSHSGQFHNFTKHATLEDDDKVEFSVFGNEVSEVRHMLDLQRLIILTSGSEVVANGDASGTLTPTALNLKTYSYNGASYVRPVIVDNMILFIQEHGAQLIGLTFDEFGRRQSFDLSLPSSDLLEGYTIVDMAYQKVPNSVVWLVRSDGKLLSFTFVAEQGIKGWAVHDTDGIVESICCIPEDNQTALYMIVQRDLPGSPGHRYVEVLEQRLISDIVGYVGMDAARTYDGRHTDGTKIVRLQGGTTYLAGEPLTAHASAIGTFHTDDVGSEIVLHAKLAQEGVDLDVRCTIIAYIDTVNVTVVANKDIPLILQFEYVQAWDFAPKTLYELWHLEGKKISILRDGNVEASPNNANYETVVTVTNGMATMEAAGSVVCAGLPFFADVETLNQDTVQGETMMGKKKQIKTLNVFVKETRGVWAGPNPPSDDTVDPLEDLDEYPSSDVDDPVEQPPPLKTDILKIRIPSRYNNNGRVFIRQVDPLPMSILAVAPAGVLPVRG